MSVNIAIVHIPYPFEYLEKIGTIIGILYIIKLTMIIDIWHFIKGLFV